MTRASTNTSTDAVIDVTDPSPEQAVRNYLMLLHSPQQLTDEEAIHKAERALEEATDHIERLLARQQLRDLQVPDVETVTETFVKHAKPWADKTGVTADTFMKEGVSADVLKKAGFDVQIRAAERSSSRKRRTRRSSGELRETIRANVPTTGTFTVKELIEKSRSSSNTVRQVLDEMIESGSVEEVGKDPDWDKVGRAPVLYRHRRAS